MTMAEESMAKSLRKIANVLESEEVQPRILREVEILIRKFPTAGMLTCPEDKLTNHQVSTRDLGGDSWVPELQGLEVKCYGEQKAVCYWRQALVLVQVQGEPPVLGCWSDKWKGSEVLESQKLSKPLCRISLLCKTLISPPCTVCWDQNFDWYQELFSSRPNFPIETTKKLAKVLRRESGNKRLFPDSPSGPSPSNLSPLL